MRHRIGLLTRVVLLLAVLLVQPASGRDDRSSEEAAGGFWSMFRQNAAHTARAPVAGPARPALDWSVPLGGLSYGSPAVDSDGTAYVGSDGVVHAVLPDGATRWSRSVGGYAISSPAITDDGAVIVGSRDGIVRALETATGAVRWSFTTGDEVWSSPVLAPDGTIYIGSFDQYLYALTSSGALRWRFLTGSEVGASPAISSDGVIYFGSLDGIFFAVRPNGQLLWQYVLESGEAIASSPAVQQGRVYAGSVDGSIYAFDAASGQRLWSFGTGGPIVSSPALAADGTAYVGSADGHLYAISPAGDERWRVPAGAEVLSSPAIDRNGLIYFGASNGRFFAVSPQGEVLWTFSADHPIWSSPAFDPGGSIYFATTGTPGVPGRLHRLIAAPFDITLSPPPAAGSIVTATISRPASFSPTSGTLFYRRGGERSYREIPVPIGPVPEFTVSIPADAVTERGLEYYVSLSDGRTTATIPVRDPVEHPVSVPVRVEELEIPLLLAPATYRMVSVPLLLEEPAIEAVLEDDYGAYDRTRWRLFGWSNERYVEHPAIPTDFSPGNAYLLVTQHAAPFVVDAGVSTSTASPYAMRLAPGWNLIGNPFAFPVAFADIGGEVRHISDRAYFDGREMLQSGEAVSVLRPWEGLFLRNSSSEAITLLIPPREATDREAPPTAEFDALRLTLATRDGRVTDSQNWVGFQGSAPVRNVREAPTLSDVPQLSILSDGERYARYLAPQAEGGAVFELEVRAPASSDRRARHLVLHLEREVPGSSLLSGNELRMVDAVSGEVIPLAGDAAVLSVESGETVRRLLLKIGQDEADPGEAVPDAFSLGQNYPNPFNPTTHIEYALAADGPVRIAVYDVLGRHVQTIVQGVRTAGFHVASWDGTDAAGRAMPSGLYFYRAETESSTVTRSMTLLR